jgi:hypothetical protein
MASQKRRKTRIGSFEIVLFVITILAAAAGAFILFGPDDGESRTAVMEARLRELRRLKTVSQTYRSVIYVEDNFWLGKKRVLFTLEYDVVAGVDFSRGLEIRELPGGVLEVRMPPAEIFSWDADESSIHQMFLKESTMLNPIRMGDYMPQVISQGEENRRSALEGGILGRAEANARSAVLRILNLGEGGEVVFGAPLNAGPAAPEASSDGDTEGEGGNG